MGKRDDLVELLGRAISVLLLSRPFPRGGRQSDAPESPGIGRYAIEVRSAARVSQTLVRDWWDRAVAHAEDSGRVPLLVYRPTRGGWRFVLPRGELNRDAPGGLDLDDTCDISLAGFLRLAEEGIL